MRAIPIDVLRAFIAVVDQRGFTRAAEDLGRTQPTISLQVKRLEELIEAPLFEKSARLTLTRFGEICLDHGRKLVARHDEMLDCLRRELEGGDAVRFGMPSEFAAFMASSLAGLSRPDGQRLNFEFVCEMSESLPERVRARQLDIALALVDEDAAAEALDKWRLPMSWIASPSFRLSPGEPLPLITSPEGSLYHRAAAAALREAGRKFEIVCRSANFDVLRGAVEAGHGVCAIPRGLATSSARELPLSQAPALPDVTLALFARAGSSPAPVLIDRIVERMRSSEALAAA
jgi:DNA-binding transcriptional LysR family regulator